MSLNSCMFYQSKHLTNVNATKNGNVQLLPHIPHRHCSPVLALTAKPPKTLYNSNPFVAPLNPGLDSVYPLNPTGHQIAEANHKHAENTHNFKTFLA